MLLWITLTGNTISMGVLAHSQAASIRSRGSSCLSSHIAAMGLGSGPAHCCFHSRVATAFRLTVSKAVGSSGTSMAAKGGGNGRPK